MISQLTWMTKNYIEHSISLIDVFNLSSETFCIYGRPLGNDVLGNVSVRKLSDKFHISTATHDDS